MEVVAAINNIIGLCDACARLAKSWKEARDLPDAFRVIHKHIPVVTELLTSARDIYQDKGSTDSKKIGGVLEECHQKARMLEVLFKKVCPDDEVGRLDRYKKTLENVIRNRQAKVEKIWEEMLKSIQLLGDFHVFQSLQPRQALLEYLKEIQSVRDSLPDSDGSRVSIGTISGQGAGVFAGDGNVETFTAWGQYGNVAREMRIYQAPTSVQIYHDDMSSSVKAHSTVEYSDCSHAFYLTNPQDNLDQTLSRVGVRAHGSGEWFLADEAFTEWRGSATARLLVVTGEPGIGKTVIATFVVECLRKEFKHLNVAVLCYFCNDAEADQRTAVAVVRGILRQLLERRRSLFEYLKGPYEDVGDKLFADFGRLWKILEKVLDVQPDPIFIIIDALDEYDPSCQDEILQALYRLHEEFLSEHCVKILLFARSSKKVTTVAGHCSGIRCLRITRAKIKDDLSVFIEREIRSISREWSQSRIDAVTSIISKKNGGTFLWVSLVLKSIVDVPPGQIERVIDQIPRKLSKLYTQLIERVQDDDERTARDALHFVLAAERPLTVTQLGLLLFFRHKRKHKEQILPEQYALDRYKDTYKACGPLLRTEVDRTDCTVVLPIHPTVKDFLTGPDLPHELGEYRFIGKKALKALTDACIFLFHVPELKKITDDMKEVLRVCARRDWRSAKGGTGHPEVLERRYFPLAGRGKSQTPGSLPKNLPDEWWDGWKLLPYTLTDYSGSWRTIKTGYRWLSILDLHSVALVPVGIGPQHIKNLFKPALDALRKTTHVAVEQGNVPVMFILLSFIGRMNIEDDHARAVNLEALLVEATITGQTVIAEALLEKTDFFEAVIRRHRHWLHDTSTAYEIVGRTLACIVRHATDLVSVDVPSTMRDRDIVDRAFSRVTELGIALLFSKANSRGLDERQSAVVKLLVEKGRAYLKRAGVPGNQMLHYAASCGASELAKLCLEHYGDRVTTVDREGKTSLHYAAIGDHVDTAHVLIRALSPGNTPSSSSNPPWLTRDKSGSLPLHYACKNGSSTMVKILVEADENRKSLHVPNFLDLRPIEVVESLYVTLDREMHKQTAVNVKSSSPLFQRETSRRQKDCDKILRYLSKLQNPKSIPTASCDD